MLDACYGDGDGGGAPLSNNTNDACYGDGDGDVVVGDVVQSCPGSEMKVVTATAETNTAIDACYGDGDGTEIQGGTDARR